MGQITGASPGPPPDRRMTWARTPSLVLDPCKSASWARVCHHLRYTSSTRVLTDQTELAHAHQGRMTTEFTGRGQVPGGSARCWNSGDLGAEFGEGEPLVTKSAVVSGARRGRRRRRPGSGHPGQRRGPDGAAATPLSDGCRAQQVRVETLTGLHQAYVRGRLSGGTWTPHPCDLRLSDLAVSWKESPGQRPEYVSRADSQRTWLRSR